MPYTTANMLTVSRILAIPAIIGLLYIEGRLWAWVACMVFTVVGLTDWLDGYLARTRAEMSEFGRFLDPIADKLLVAATLMALVALDRIAGASVFAALVILCREILVSGLREFLAGLKVSVPVSRLSKWKTAIQMVAIGVLIVGDHGPAIVPIRLIGELGLGAAALLTLLTGYDYLRAGLRHMRGENPAMRSHNAARTVGG